MRAADIPETVRQRVREAAGDRCGYCLSSQRYVMGILEVEHIFPHGRGGSDDENNLWLACSLCNRYKGSQVTGRDPLTGETAPLFNPRTNAWREHFRWSADGTQIIGLTPIGRVTVEALQLNNEVAVTVRGNWVAAGWHPPTERTRGAQT